MASYTSLDSLYGHLLAAIDIETTGVRAGWHEIVQIAIVPLDVDLNPVGSPFVTLIRPEHPERVEDGARRTHRIDDTDLETAPTSEQVIEWLVEWFNKLNLPLRRRLVPLAQNWAFESAFLKAWLGVSLCDDIFQAQARDSMILATAINDLAAIRGETLPFDRVNLGALCSKMKVVNLNPHDALADCLATAQVYKALLRML